MVIYIIYIVIHAIQANYLGRLLARLNLDKWAAQNIMGVVGEYKVQGL